MYKRNKVVSKVTTLALVMILLLANASLVFAENPKTQPFSIIPSRVGLVIDGEIQIWDKSYGEIISTDKGRTLLPIAIVSQRLGYVVGWESATQTVSIFQYKKNVEGDYVTNDKGDKIKDMDISFKLGDTQISHPNGVVVLDVPAFAKDGRTYLPFQFLADGLGLKVGWEPFKNIEGSRKHKFDFYVTVDTVDENGNKLKAEEKSFYGLFEPIDGYVSELGLGIYDLKNPRVQKIVKEVSKMDMGYDDGKGRYACGPSRLIIGVDDFINAEYAWLEVNTMSSNEVEFRINGWDEESCRFAFKELINLWFPEDADWIWNEIVGDETTKLDEWWMAPNGTQGIFTERINGLILKIKKR